MQKLKFWKMSGAGNDFALLTGGRRGTAALKKLAVKLCARRSGVGADGLLYVRPAGRGAVSVRYFNSDGSEAFCGNGSRCAAWWAYSRGLAGKKFDLYTAAGVLPAAIVGRESVRMRMPDVDGASLGHKGRYPRGIGGVHFLNTGVPHAVTVVRGLEATDVRGLGRLLRFNRVFGRAGSNVDFVELKGGRAGIRTYERGVEDETLACGTGITAAAVALVLTGQAAAPVTLTARSGEKFKVWLKPVKAGAREIFIQGPARIVFQGEIKC
ncbi:MAG: diaminopimelate epimerase [Elusimicrobiales bacterium]|nr:diaminopimelate epimerase [Elusimicrobiales bacterium]